MTSLLSRSDGGRRLPMPPPLVPIGVAGPFSSLVFRAALPERMSAKPLNRDRGEWIDSPFA